MSSSQQQSQKGGTGYAPNRYDPYGSYGYGGGNWSGGYFGAPVNPQPSAARSPFSTRNQPSGMGSALGGNVNLNLTGFPAQTPQMSQPFYGGTSVPPPQAAPVPQAQFKSPFNVQAPTTPAPYTGGLVSEFGSAPPDFGPLPPPITGSNNPMLAAYMASAVPGALQGRDQQYADFIARGGAASGDPWVGWK